MFENDLIENNVIKTDGYFCYIFQEILWFRISSSEAQEKNEY